MLKKKMSVNLSFDLYDELKKRSKVLGVNMSVIIHMAVRKWLSENSKVFVGKE
jgi:post-segregation antitoxin (ccd killing protein)